MWMDLLEILTMPLKRKAPRSLQVNNGLQEKEQGKREVIVQVFSYVLRLDRHKQELHYLHIQNPEMLKLPTSCANFPS